MRDLIIYVIGIGLIAASLVALCNMSLVFIGAIYLVGLYLTSSWIADKLFGTIDEIIDRNYSNPDD